MWVLIMLVAIATCTSGFLFYRHGWKTAMVVLSAFAVSIWASFSDLFTALVAPPAAVPPEALGLAVAPAAGNPAVPVLVVVAAVVALYTLYRAVHSLAPGWGTILTNAVAAVAAIVGVLQGLPWASVLGPKEVGWVMLGLAIVNGLMRVTPSKAEPPMATK